MSFPTQHTVVRRFGSLPLITPICSSMDDVRRAIERTTEFATAMKPSSQTQAAKIDSLGDAVRAMDESTQQNSALVEQVAAAASMLHQQAEGLAADVGAFKF